MHRRIRLHALWPFLPYIVMATVHVIALAMQSAWAVPTKALLMPLLAVAVCAAWRRVAPRSAAVLLLFALLFSWLGDEAALFFPFAPELPLMLGFFGVAHILYIALFLRHLRVRRLPVWTAVYALWWLLMMVTLGPHTGGLLIALGVYGALLAGTAATSARCRAMVAAGGAFFLASDSILAFRLFLPDAMPAWTSPAVMITYTIAQGLLVAGALRGLAPARSPRLAPAGEEAVA